MRVLIALTAAVLMLSSFKTSQDAKPITMKKGSVMTYSDDRFAPDGTTEKNPFSFTVTEVKGNSFFCDIAASTGTTKAAFTAGKEFFTWDSVNEDGTLDTGTRLFKVGAKPGDKWAVSPDSQLEMTYEAEEEVNTPAGKFMAKKISISPYGGLMKITYWVSDKVCLVKATQEVKGKLSAQLDLQKFVEGK